MTTMIILDFFVYYLTIWFERNRDKLVWSSPLERACYVIGVATEYTFPKILYLFIGLGAIQLYIYL